MSWSTCPDGSAATSRLHQSPSWGQRHVSLGLWGKCESEATSEMCSRMPSWQIMQNDGEKNDTCMWYFSAVDQMVANVADRWVMKPRRLDP